MSLTFAYYENFRRRQSPPQASLWGLKNNQARKERFFRWFLSFVVIKSNLDAFALVLFPSPLTFTLFPLLQKTLLQEV
jgi:hypothetical protein